MSARVVGFAFFLFPALNKGWNLGTCGIDWHVPKYGKVYDFIKSICCPSLSGPTPQLHSMVNPIYTPYEKRISPPSHQWQAWPCYLLRVMEHEQEWCYLSDSRAVEQGNSPSITVMVRWPHSEWDSLDSQTGAQVSNCLAPGLQSDQTVKQQGGCSRCLSSHTVKTVKRRARPPFTRSESQPDLREDTVQADI